MTTTTTLDAPRTNTTRTLIEQCRERLDAMDCGCGKGTGCNYNASLIAACDLWLTAGAAATTGEHWSWPTPTTDMLDAYRERNR